MFHSILLPQRKCGEKNTHALNSLQNRLTCGLKNTKICQLQSKAYNFFLFCFLLILFPKHVPHHHTDVVISIKNKRRAPVPDVVRVFCLGCPKFIVYTDRRGQRMDWMFTCVVVGL